MMTEVIDTMIEAEATIEEDQDLHSTLHQEGDTALREEAGPDPEMAATVVEETDLVVDTTIETTTTIEITEEVLL